MSSELEPGSHERWASEAAFFDREAEEARRNLRPILPETLHRYGVLRRRRWNKEMRFRLLGDLRGRRILDVGCGDGVNSTLLAKLGATVTGVDISPAAVALAAERAALNGVSDRTTFVCAPIEGAQFAPASFDVIWIDAVLHHVLPVLEGLLAQVKTWLAPGGTVIISEPVNLFPALRQLRLALPLATHATPGERPLEAADIAVLERIFPGIQLHPFHGLARLNRFLLPDHTLETAGAWRRLLLNGIAATDVALLRLPGFRRLAGVAVFHGRVGT